MFLFAVGAGVGVLIVGGFLFIGVFTNKFVVQWFVESGVSLFVSDRHCCTIDSVTDLTPVGF